MKVIAHAFDTEIDHITATGVVPDHVGEELFGHQVECESGVGVDRSLIYEIPQKPKDLGESIDLPAEPPPHDHHDLSSKERH